MYASCSVRAIDAFNSCQNTRTWLTDQAISHDLIDVDQVDGKEWPREFKERDQVFTAGRLLGLHVSSESRASVDLLMDDLTLLDVYLARRGSF
jgi:hypothetical protein